MITIGIDTGGTCTDAVIYDDQTGQILATGKTLTTRSNLEKGIARALDALPEALLKNAERFSLSTTLATNACVENKGCRAKLLLMGAPEDMIVRLQSALADYGITDISQLVAIDAKPENLYAEPLEPDWEELRCRAPELFSGCDCVGIVQSFPEFNGGRFELTALRLLQEELTIPLTIAYDITQETDFLKICSSILLNARLIPMITDFIKAVHHVMEQRGLDLPISIVRSDGTLMSEEMARTCPVETLLCGPVASVIGGSTLAAVPDALVVDMGGTTTDLAMIRSGEPILAGTGIHIGQYKTSIHGLDARACSLGGDTAIRFHDRKMYLDTTRVIPVSVLAQMYPNVLPDLIRFRNQKIRHTRPVHEFFVLQKNIDGRSEYTDYEKHACEVLKGHPMLVQDFAKTINRGDLYHLRIERLEQEGILIRSGITPTDLMVLKGDLAIYDREAAEIMMECAAWQMEREDPEKIPDEGYDLVIRRLYETITLFLLQHQYENDASFASQEQAQHLMDLFYEEAAATIQQCKQNVSTDSYVSLDVCKEKASDTLKSLCKTTMVHLSLTTQLPLIGIGAPTHVFLPKVAELLQTRVIMPEHAAVANALGAAVCRRIARWDQFVKVIYKDGLINGYSVMDGTTLRRFNTLAEALTLGREITLRNLKERALLQGLGTNPEIEITEEEDRLGNASPGALMGVTLHGLAR